MSRPRGLHFIQNGVEVKQCFTCKRVLPVTLDYYFSNKPSWDGFSYDCRECRGSCFVYHANEGYKICNKCGREIELSPEYFRRKSKHKDGYDGTCKECRGVVQSPPVKLGFKICNKCGEELPDAIEYFNKDKKGINELSHTCRKCRIEQKRQYNDKNREWINEKGRQYIPLHKEELRIISQRRRSRKSKLPSTLTKEQWTGIKLYFNNQCCYCGQEKPLTQDHFIPISKGGEYSHNNIVPACGTCNRSKNNSDFFIWYPGKKFYSKQREKTLLRFLGYKGRIQQLALM